MLVLSRRVGEQIRIGDNVVLTVLRVRGNVVRVGIDAAAEVSIRRAELPDEPAGGLAGRATGMRGKLPPRELVADLRR